MTLPTRRIGDLSVSVVGIGCMPLSNTSMLDKREQAIATLHHALDLGITLLDTANIYAPDGAHVGHNEALVGEAVRTYDGPSDRKKIVIATKGGITREPGAHGDVWGRDSKPESLRAAVEASLERLGVDVIDVYQHHRHDPSLSYEAQVRAMVALKDAGLVRRIGLSNVQLPELEVALDIAGGPNDGGIVSVQNEFSPRYRGERDVLDRCTDLGIAFLPWSPLGGADQAHNVSSHFAVFGDVAREAGCTVQEAVLAWHRQLSPVVIAIPGASRPTTVDSIITSLTVTLTDGQMARLAASAADPDSMYPDDLPRSPLRG